MSKFPMTMPGGHMIPHMSARKRTELIDALFYGAGGYARALAWIEKSDENYGTFLNGMWAKGAARAVSVEHNAGADLEGAIDRLDKAANAKTIDGSFTEVPNDGK